MKRLVATLLLSIVLAGAAHAADAVVFDAPAAPAAALPYDWSGLYIGAFGGIATGDEELSATDGTDSVGLDISASGGFGGAQIGYDWQAGRWVFGAVADIAATSYGAELSADVDFGGGSGGATAESTLDYLGTVRARIGHAFDRTLVYGHGGYAYGKMSQSIDFDFGGGSTSLFDDSTTKSGFVVGAGVEHAFTDSISFQTEYSYVDLGEDTIATIADVDINEDVKFHTIKAAINYRF